MYFNRYQIASLESPACVWWWKRGAFLLQKAYVIWKVNTVFKIFPIFTITCESSCKPQFKVQPVSKIFVIKQKKSRMKTKKTKKQKKPQNYVYFSVVFCVVICGAFQVQCSWHGHYFSLKHSRNELTLSTECKETAKFSKFHKLSLRLV